MGDRAAILVAIVIILFPLPWYFTVPLGILVYLFIRYLKYLDATEATKRERNSNQNATGRGSQ